MELMGGHRHTRDGYESLCLRDLPKDNLILTLYMLSAWWLHLLDGLGHYVIPLGEFSKILVMDNNITTLGYTDANRSIKNPPEILCKIVHIGRLILWVPSRLAWTPELRGRVRSLLCTNLPKTLSGTNNQDGPTDVDISIRYTLWDSGFNPSINPYFELYTEYKPLEKGDDAEVNGIGGLIKTKGIGTVVLELE